MAITLYDFYDLTAAKAGCRLALFRGPACKYPTPDV
jgi:hypothetical protein